MSEFLRIVENPEFSDDRAALDYSNFGLSANYLVLEEYDSALEKLDLLLSSDLDAELKSAVFYNKGIIFHRRGDFERAVENFKKSVLAWPKNENAKINLELCLQEMGAKKNASGEQEMQEISQSSEESMLQKEIFSLIRKQESSQWRNLSSQEDDSGEIDY